MTAQVQPELSAGSSSELPRPYLRAADRRRQLLDAAASIAAQDGLDNLSMAGLASAAGVSRQLVYEHFSDRSSLVHAVLLDRLADLDAVIADELAAAKRDSGDARSVAGLILSRPPEERRMLRALLLHADVPGDELAGLARSLRDRVIDRWAAFLGTPNHRPSRPATWALVNAMFGLSDMVDAGAITVNEAISYGQRIATELRDTRTSG